MHELAKLFEVSFNDLYVFGLNQTTAKGFLPLFSLPAAKRKPSVRVCLLRSMFRKKIPVNHNPKKKSFKVLFITFVKEKSGLHSFSFSHLVIHGWPQSVCNKHTYKYIL